MRFWSSCGHTLESLTRRINDHPNNQVYRSVSVKNVSVKERDCYKKEEKMSLWVSLQGMFMWPERHYLLWLEGSGQEDEYLTCSLFFLTIPHRLWDLSSQIRVQNWVHSSESPSLNHWIAAEVSHPCSLKAFFLCLFSLTIGIISGPLKQRAPV